MTLSGPLAALDADEMFADPAKEARAREIGRELRCLVCQNQSIFDSNAGLAKDLRVAVRERITAGDTDQEVLTYLSSRFGDYVLLKPQVQANTYVLWIAPFLFLLVGAGAIIAYHLSRDRRVPDPVLTDEERAEAQRLLNRE
jgi:cytochrome c-type biogenesis protein CcmH